MFYAPLAHVCKAHITLKLSLTDFLSDFSESIKMEGRGRANKVKVLSTDSKTKAFAILPLEAFQQLYVSSSFY